MQRMATEGESAGRPESKGSPLARLALVSVSLAVFLGLGTAIGWLFGAATAGIAAAFTFWLALALPAILLGRRRDSRQALRSFYLLGRLRGPF